MPSRTGRPPTGVPAGDSVHGVPGTRVGGQWQGAGHQVPGDGQLQGAGGSAGECVRVFTTFVIVSQVCANQPSTLDVWSSAAGQGEAQSMRERERAIRQNRDLPGCRGGGGALALTSTAC